MVNGNAYDRKEYNFVARRQRGKSPILLEFSSSTCSYSSLNLKLQFVSYCKRNLAAAACDYLSLFFFFFLLQFAFS